MKKKVLLFIVLIICIIGVCFVLFNKDDTNYLKEISYEEYSKKVKNKESFILYMKRNNCPYCEEFSPVFEEVLNEFQVQAYLINLSNISKDEKDMLTDELSFTGTPVVMFFEDGKELGMYARIIGAKEKELVIEKLKLRGYIK